MKEWLHKIEVIVDWIIPYLVLILLFVILGEFFYNKYLEYYKNLITYFDYFIIFVFTIDLIFKYERVKKIPLFIKKYWLDIIAIFPFVLLFRLYADLASLLGRSAETITESQIVFHEGLELEKTGSKIVREAEEVGKISRVRLIARLIRPLAKIPKLFKITPRIHSASIFYETPTGKHYIHEKKRKK